MAFTVEDGTAKTDSNAYCSVEYADSWFDDAGGNATWTAASTAAKQAAIVKATRYIDSLFGPRFRSCRRTRTQALQWPRDAVYDDGGNLWIQSTEVPPEIKKATAEYAVRALSADLISDPDDSRDAVQVSEKVGPIATSMTYASGSSRIVSGTTPSSAISSYPAADMWLEDLLESSVEHEVLRV